MECTLLSYLPPIFWIHLWMNFYFFAFLAISSDLRVLLTLHSAVDIAVIIVVLVLPLSESIKRCVIVVSLEPKKQNFKNIISLTIVSSSHETVLPVYKLY